MDHKHKTLLDRMTAGADYIESIGGKHPNYPAALKKYDRLYEELKVFQSWLI